MITAEPTLATVNDYDGLIAAIRAQKEKLGLTDAALDELTGLQQGYCGKLLGPAQVKNLGPLSFGVMLQALGLSLIVVEDIETLARLKGRFDEKCRSQSRFGNVAKPLGKRVIERVKPLLFKQLGKQGGLKRMATMSPYQRKALARHAAKTRHAQDRSEQRKRWRDKRKPRSPAPNLASPVLGKET